jgi:hypothetical protein
LLSTFNVVQDIGDDDVVSDLILELANFEDEEWDLQWCYAFLKSEAFRRGQ